MRVVDIINASTSADTLLRERVLAMRAQGIDNHIVCADGPRIEALRALGIPVHTVDVPRNLHPWKLAVALAQIAAYLRHTQADVVHTHCAIPGLIGRLAGRPETRQVDPIADVVPAPGRAEPEALGLLEVAPALGQQGVRDPPA